MRRKRHFPFNCLDLFVSLWLFRELKMSQWLKKKVYSSSLKINISQMFSYCWETKHRGKYPLIKGWLFLVICQSAISGLRTPRKTVCFSLASGSLPWHLGLKQVTDWLMGGGMINIWENHFQSPQEKKNGSWNTLGEAASI